MQVAIPLGFQDKCPVSVSFLAGHGSDRFLLDSLHTVYATLQEQLDVVKKSKTSNNAVTREASAELAKEKVDKDELNAVVNCLYCML